MNRLIGDRIFEAVIDLAGGVESIAEDFEGERRRQRLRGVLEDIVARLDCHRPDDLAARAVAALAEGWAAVLEIEQQDADYAHLLVDDDE